METGFPWNPARRHGGISCLSCETNEMVLYCDVSCLLGFPFLFFLVELSFFLCGCVLEVRKRKALAGYNTTRGSLEPNYSQTTIIVKVNS